jgi:hypothetical protein
MRRGRVSCMAVFDRRVSSRREDRFAFAAWLLRTRDGPYVSGAQRSGGHDQVDTAGKGSRPCSSKPTCDLTVALDLELPEDQIAPAELDLIEVHFAELIQRVLAEAETEKEVTDGRRTVRPGLDDKAG